MSVDEEATRIEQGQAFAWRLSMKACREALGARFSALDFMEEGQGPNAETGLIRAEPDRLGDVILGRKDVGTSYHLACTHDDQLQAVTHVIRGADLFFATHLHVLLQALMDWPTPTYRHHRLLTGPDGTRFAKRDKALTLKALRADGLSTADIRARVEL